MDLHDGQREAEKALARIKELERKVEALEGRMNDQHGATQDLTNRVGKLERGIDGWPC